MTVATYDNSYYERRHQKSVAAARAVLSIVFDACADITRVIDVGCGVGSWLSVAAEMGGARLAGFDGDWVPSEHLVIKPSEFTASDLETLRKSDLPPRDLTISLEVAEHLSEARAASFVELLTDRSEWVLFSAAIPGQPGKGHVNMKPPSYWEALFKEQGFKQYDVIRPQIWDRDDAPYWYKQNTMLYGRCGLELASAHQSKASAGIGFGGRYLVHPTLLESQVRALRERLEQNGTAFRECGVVDQKACAHVAALRDAEVQGPSA
jgi:hypothetical protein